MLKFGSAFSENVSVTQKRWQLPKSPIRGWGARVTILHTLLIFFFFLLFVRLFHLTIVQGNENRSLSQENRVRTAIIHAPRGIFYDRRGVALVTNIDAFRVTGPCKTHEICRTKLQTQEEWQKSGINPESVFLEKDYFRQYQYPLELSHVLGYLGEISDTEARNLLYTYQDYHTGDRLGRMGLEAVFEKKLRGIDGKELIEINSQNNRVRSLGKIDATGGQNLYLSLDADLQKAAYEALMGQSGAVVVSKPKTGEILALVSSPSFDPNVFHAGISQADYESLVKNSERPLFDRAVSGVYPPGSTFKLIAAIAGLESGTIDKNTQIDDTGILRIGDFSFANWYFTQYGKTEGQVDILKAIARSNDIYFYNVGERVGIPKIAEWGRKFGIGQKTGVELTGEAEGLMPDIDYQRKVHKTDWFLGDTYHIAIGQGDLQTTPLQVNRWTNAIASGGTLCDFTLLKQTLTNSQPRCKNLGIKKENLDLVVEGMRRACSKGDDTTYQGTGYPLFDFSVTHEVLTGSSGSGEIRKIPVACKTGTSEFGDPEGKTHALFTAFAPVPIKSSPDTMSGDPEIVVTVLVEKGGEGSTVAGPIAKKIFEEWFKR